MSFASAADRNFRGMEMNNLPSMGRVPQHNRPTVHESRPVIEMEADNCNVAVHLHFHVMGLDVHEWRVGSAGADLFENDLEVLLKLGAAIRSFRH